MEFKKFIRLMTAVLIVVSVFITPFLSNVNAKNEPRATWHQQVTPSEAKCWSLDVAVLVDQSSSMFSDHKELDLITNESRNYPASDPNNYRYKAVKEILSRLATNQIEECPLATHRFSMITFGQKADQIISTPVSGLRREERKAWLDSFDGDLGNAAGNRTYTATNPQAAFDQAQAWLIGNDILPDQEGYGARKRVIILLTDGEPTGYYDSLKNYMARLETSTGKSEWSENKIFIVTLNNGVNYLNLRLADNDRRTIRDVYKDIANSHQGRLIELDYNEQTIPSSLYAIFQDVIGRPGKTIVCGEKFYVDPYLSSIDFIFFHREGEGDGIKLQKLNDAGNVEYEIIDDEITLNEASSSSMTFDSERYTEGSSEVKKVFRFDLPLAGTWKFEVVGKRVAECSTTYDASAYPLEPEIWFEEPIPGIIYPMIETAPYYKEGEEILYKINLKTTTGEPILQVKEFPITMTVDVTLPKEDLFPAGFNLADIKGIELFEQGDGLWSNSQKPFLTPQEGGYQILVKAETISGDRKSTITIFQEGYSVLAKKLIPFSFEMTLPNAALVVGEDPQYEMACNYIENGQKINNPLNIEVVVKDENHQTVSPDQYLVSDLDQSFFVSLVDAKNNPLQEQPLKLTFDKSRNVFKGELLSGGGQPLLCDQISVKAEFVGRFDVTKYSLPKPSIEYDITRRLGEGVGISITDKRDLKIFKTFKDAWQKNVAPFEFTFSFADLDGKGLKVEDVSENPGSLMKVYVYPKGIDRESLPENQTLLQISYDKGTATPITVTGGTNWVEPGNYVVEIIPQQTAFKDGFIPTQESFQEEVTRFYWFWASPNLVKGVQIFLIILAIVLAILLIFNIVTAPRGVVGINNTNENSDVWSAKMRPLRWLNSFSGRKLKEIGFNRLIMRKADPKIYGGERAISIKGYDTSNVLILDNVLVDDNRMSISDDYDIGLL